MLSLLRRLASRPAPTAGPPDDRHIFRLSVAGQVRHYDPFVVERELMRAAGDDWTQLPYRLSRLRQPLAGVEPAQAKALRDQRDEATAQVVAMSRAAFGLVPLGPDGTGVTEAEAINAMYEYVGFCAALVERHRPLA